jgi:hypothetical protein
MEVTRATFDDDSSGYIVEYDGETYSFEVLGSSAVRFVDDRRLPPEVAAEMQSLGFGTVEVSKDFHVRKDDPEDPHIGMRWYRSDRGAVRAQMSDGSVEERSVFDVPSETIIEDFEGESASDFDTDATAGDPTYEIVDRNGDDWFKLTADPSDVGELRFDVGREITGVGAEMEMTDGNVVGNIIILPEQTPSTGYVVLLHNRYNGLFRLFQATDAEPSGDRIETGYVDDPAEFGEPFTSYISIDGGTVSARVETYAGDYEISGTLPNPDAAGGQYVSLSNSPAQDDSGSIYFDDVRELTGGLPDGQLSPALSHSDLADAPAAAHHTPPSAGAGIENNANTFRTKLVPEDLSQRSGEYDGELAADDGTNTPARGTLCLWDDTNLVWRQQNDPTQTI